VSKTPPQRQKHLLVSPETIRGELAILRGADVSHIIRVMRLDVGAKLSLANGDGELFWGTIESHDKNKVCLRIDRREQVPRQKPAISLVYGMAKSTKTETVLQKATELGVDRIILAVCQRSVSRPKDLGRKEERMKEIIRQAARQSDRVYLPELTLCSSFRLALKETHETHLRLVTSFSGASLSSLDAVQWRNAAQITIAVGPEGGLTADEEKQAVDVGFVPIRLGPLTLRTETAAIAGLSLINFLSGRFSD
jgi:16S rRNA (uracil1498-N3)-methyltransferase